MFDEELNPSTRTELLRLTPSGDLLDLAREMRDMGVESLLFAGPSGRITQVVSDRQIAHLAANPDPSTTVLAGPPTGSPEVSPTSGPADIEPVIPPQVTPARADAAPAVVRR